MVPTILSVHKQFLEELKRRLDSWEPLQIVGDIFLDIVSKYLITPQWKVNYFSIRHQFSKANVLDAYDTFVNNSKRAKDAIRLISSTRPAFSRFLEAMAREHKGKLTLDTLLIKPVQKFPK